MFNDQKSKDKEIIPETFGEAFLVAKETQKDFLESNGDEQKLVISQAAWDHAFDKSETINELEQLRTCMPKNGGEDKGSRHEKMREKMEKLKKKETEQNVDGGGIIDRIKKVFVSA